MGLNTYGYPDLNDCETRAMRDKEKAEMLAKSCAKIHSSDNISEEKKEEG